MKSKTAGVGHKDAMLAEADLDCAEALSSEVYFSDHEEPMILQEPETREERLDRRVVVGLAFVVALLGLYVGLCLALNIAPW